MFKQLENINFLRFQESCLGTGLYWSSSPSQGMSRSQWAAISWVMLHRRVTFRCSKLQHRKYQLGHAAPPRHLPLQQPATQEISAGSCCTATTPSAAAGFNTENISWVMLHRHNTFRCSRLQHRKYQLGHTAPLRHLPAG